MARRTDSQLEEALGIRSRDPLEAGSLAFMGSHLVQMTLPHSDQGERESYTRENGNYQLVVQGMPGVGLPYGAIPRLILAWLTTEVKNTKSPSVKLGNSLRSFMKGMGYDPRGGKRGNIEPVKDQTKRLFLSRIAVVNQNEKGIQSKLVNFAEQFSLFWEIDEEAVGQQGELFSSRVELNEKFYNMIVERPVPLDNDVLKMLRDSSLALDLYMFLTYRVSYLNRDLHISWDSLEKQFGADYSKTAEFARNAREQLKRIQVVWPDLEYETPRGRLLLKGKSKPHVKPKRRVFPAS